MRNLILVLALCLTACGPSGRKVLDMEVESSQGVVLETSFDVADTASTAEMWDAAGKAPFSTKSASLTAQEDDPLRAVLEGPVEVRISWVAEVETTVRVEGLVLVRSDASKDDWHLSADEVRRAKELTRK